MTYSFYVNENGQRTLLCMHEAEPPHETEAHAYDRFRAMHEEKFGYPVDPVTADHVEIELIIPDPEAGM